MGVRKKEIPQPRLYYRRDTPAVACYTQVVVAQPDQQGKQSDVYKGIISIGVCLLSV